MPTRVQTADGNAVYGLEGNDFILEDVGIRQAVYLDEAAANEPISLLIAIEAGRRAKREFPRMRGMVAMLDSMLREPCQ